VSNGATLEIQNLLRKLYERAEKTKGQKAGAYITPERTFTEEQMAFMISEQDVVQAVGRLATFDTKRGAKQSISDIFSTLNLDADDKIAVRPFVTICDPLVMVKAALGVPETSMVAGDVRTVSAVPTATVSKLQSMFDEATVKGSAAQVTEKGASQFTVMEQGMRLSVEGFADLIRSVTDFDAIVTPSDGALEIDTLFDKLNMNGDDHVSVKEFLQMITPTSKQAEKAKKKSGRKRFNTWGRKKKARSVDAHLGIGVGDDDVAAETEGFAAKRAVFGGQVLF
jgi:hypothetical protein